MAILVTDKFALFAGILVYVLYSLCMVIFGQALGWDALNENDPNGKRFDPEPAVNPGAWYFWQLPKSQKNVAYDVIVWLFYGAHQLLSWWIIAEAQNSKAVYGKVLKKWNFWAFGVHAFFHVLHMIQTYTMYESTAATSPEGSSQGSVIMMLSILITMEFSRRGVFCGWPGPERRDKLGKKVFLSSLPGKLLRKYHGYAISWAIVYTFWYHPTHGTWGHAMGFLYTALLMVQGSLFYTFAHRERWWRFMLESFVAVHSGVIAVQTGGVVLAPMFISGFLFVVTFTYVYGLTFWQDMAVWTRAIPPLLYLIVSLSVYGGWLGWARLNEIIRIPGFLYAFSGGIWLLLWALGVFWYKVLRKEEKEEKEEKKEEKKAGSWVPGFAVETIVYFIAIAISLAMYQISLSMDLLIMMAILVIIYVVLMAVGVVMHASYDNVLKDMTK